MKIDKVTTRAASILSGNLVAAILMLFTTPAAATPEADAFCGKTPAVAAEECKAARVPDRNPCLKALQDILDVAKKGTPADKFVADTQQAALGDHMTKKSDVDLAMITAVCALYKKLPVNAAPTAPVAAAPTGLERKVEPLEAKDQICRKFCSPPGSFCLEAETGEEFCSAPGSQTYDKPSQLNGGDQLLVQVWGRAGVGDEGTPDLNSTERISRDGAFPKGQNPKGAAGAAANAPFVMLVEKLITVSTSSNVQSVTIHYTWTLKDTTDPPVSRDYVITIDHGMYYLEVGLLMPLVIHGTRTVTPSLVPGTGGEKRLRLTEDSVVTPAIALNIFPGGRRNGRVTAFDPCRGWDLVGMQLAVDLNLKEPFERVYGGVVFEPIAGLSLNAGLAMVKGDVIPPEYAEGMLVPKDETFTPDRRYFPRPYFGLTLTNEIVTAISGAAQKFKTASPN